jgi:hypothetical protein
LSLSIDLPPISQTAAKMSNWLRVLTRAKECLEGILYEDSKPAASEDRAQSFINNIIGLSKLTKGHKLLSNIEVAAMHLQVYMQVSFFYPLAYV